MFLRATTRRKDGKVHRYWSIVENRRLPGGRVLQRHLLYLGEINSSQERAWRKSVEVFDERTEHSRSLALFPEDRIDEGVVDESVVRLCLSQLRLCRPRVWGSCWLALKLWGAAVAGSFLARASAREPQGYALGSGTVRAGGVSTVLSRQRMASASGSSTARCVICSAPTMAWLISTRCTPVTIA